MPDDDFLQAMACVPTRMASRLALLSQDRHTARNVVVADMLRDDSRAGVLSERLRDSVPWPLHRSKPNELRNWPDIRVLSAASR